MNTKNLKTVLIEAVNKKKSITLETVKKDIESLDTVDFAKLYNDTKKMDGSIYRNNEEGLRFFFEYDFDGFLETIYESIKNGDYNPKDNWVKYDRYNKELVSKRNPRDFVDIELFAKAVIQDDYALEVLEDLK